MELKELIKLKKLTVTAAAKEIGISRQMLSDIINNRFPAGAHSARLIFKWSDGAVGMQDLWEEMRQN